jgi:hypothetical protein
VLDTLPKVMATCFESKLGAACSLDKSDWVYRLPNGSEIWFGGLDDRERTEKVLGQEHATLYFNECSQIAWASRNIAITRLAQQTELPLRAYYDCNPPGDGHWTGVVCIRWRAWKSCIASSLFHQMDRGRKWFNFSEGTTNA